PRQPGRWSRRWRAARCRLRLAAEQCAHFRLAEPAVPPGCPYAADAAGCRPPGNRLRVYPEERSHLPWSEKPLIVAIHVHPSYTRFGARLQCRENIRLLPCFPQNEPLRLVVSFGLDRNGLRAAR